MTLPPAGVGVVRMPGAGLIQSPVVPLILGGAAAALILAVPWPLNLYLVLAAGALVVALVAPAVALGLLVASVPVQDVGAVASGPAQLTVTKVLLLTLVAGWALRVAGRRRLPRLAPPAALFAGYVLALGMSVANARSRGAWAGEVYRWASALAVYVVAIDVIRDVRSARPALVGTVAAAGGASLLGFYQVAVAAGPPSFRANGVTRAFATFDQPNPFAGYLELTVPLLAAVGVGRLAARAGPTRLGGRDSGAALAIMSGLAAAIGLIALGLTQSRGGWLGGLAGLGAVLWLVERRLRWLGIGLAIVLTGLLLATPLGRGALTRVESGLVPSGANVQVTPENFAVYERLAHWRAGIAMVRRRPLLGVGAGNFTANFRDVTRDWRFRISRGHAHNAYIQAAAQAGLIGLTAYLAMLAAIGVRLRHALREAGAEARPLVIGAIGVTVAFMIHSVFEYLHALSLGVQLSVVWALAESARHGPGLRSIATEVPR